MAPQGRSGIRPAAIATFIAVTISVVPAWALDDDGKKNIFSSVGELFTLGDQSNRDIQYRERAPLVIPPNSQQLSQPRPATQRDTGWMNDRKASGRRSPTAVARASDPDRGTLTEPPNDYFRKQGTKPLPDDASKQGFVGGLLTNLNPFKKEEE